MMKYILIFLSLVLLIVFAGILLVASHAQVDQSSAGKDSAQPVQQPTWEYPVAAGVWYPTDGPLPEKPMRYYRVRCYKEGQRLVIRLVSAFLDATPPVASRVTLRSS